MSQTRKFDRHASRGVFVRESLLEFRVQNTIYNPKVGDFVFRLPKFQEGYAFKHAARGMTIEFSSWGHTGISSILPHLNRLDQCHGSPT